MSDDLKLLIELAWANGYELPNEADDVEQFYIYEHKNVTGRLLINQDMDEAYETFNVEFVIFQHDFIAALCKAKWNTAGMGESYTNYTVRRILKDTVLKPESERIAYLKEVFL